MAGNRAIFQEALEKGHEFAWAEDWPRAVEEYRRGVAELPKDPLAQRLLGFALLQAGKEDEALQVYHRLRETNPEDVDPYERMAEILQRKGRFLETQSVLLSLADLYQKLGDGENYDQTLKRALILDPQNPQLAGHLAPLSSLPEDTRKAGERYLRLAQLLEEGEEGGERYLRLARILKEEGERYLRLAQPPMEEGKRGRGTDPVPEAMDLQPTGNEAPELPEVRDLQPTGNEAPELPEVRDLQPTSDEAPELLSPLAPEYPIPGYPEEAPLALPGPTFHALHWLETKISDFIAEEELASGGGGGKKLAAHRAVSQALALQREGKWAEALQQYALLGGEELGNNQIQISRGLLLALVGECSQAQSLLQGIKDPEYFPAINHALGDCYLRRSRPQEALSYLLQSLRLLDLAIASPDEVAGLEAAYDHLLSAYRKKGGRFMQRIAYHLVTILGSPDWEEKIAGMRGSLKIMAAGGPPIPIAEILEFPQPEELMGYLFRIQTAMQRHEYFLAIEQAYRALENWSDYLPLQVLLAEVLAQGERVKEAEEKFRTLAKVFEVQGDQEHARAVLRRASSLAPQGIGTPRKP